MKTNRRDFLGLIGAAFGALALPRTQRPPEAPLPQPRGLLPPPEESAGLGLTDATGTKVDLWQPAHDTYQIHDMVSDRFFVYAKEPAYFPHAFPVTVLSTYALDW